MQRILEMLVEDIKDGTGKSPEEEQRSDQDKRNKVCAGGKRCFFHD